MSISEDLHRICSNVSFDEPMKLHTSFKIGGPCDIFCEPDSVLEIKELINYFKNNSIKFLIIGNGSNILVSDSGIEGAVIKIGKKLAKIKVYGDEIHAEAGALLSKVANVALNNELSGMEAISGIPGSVGGAVYMNAGAYGTEMKDVLKEVTFVTPEGDIRTLGCDMLELGYRKSIFTNTENVVVSCVFKLCNGDKSEILEKMKDYTKRRNEKQPVTFPSAGSVFKRPPGYFAGKLIEDSGLKGYRIGGAMISELHAGFIINYNDATCEDVKKLIEYAQKTVFEKFGVMIEPEIKIIER